jgi:hypothetical protein
MSRIGPAVSWEKGEPLDHRKLNDMRGIREIRVGPGLRMVRSPDGSVAISLAKDSTPRRNAVRLTITSITSSAGSKYGVQKLNEPTADVSPSGDAAAADLGTADAVDAIGVDTNELGRAASSHLNAVGQVVDGELVHVNADGTRVYTFAAAPGPGDVFAVSAAVTAGTAASTGDASTAAGFQYDVTASSNGETLGTAVAPAMARENGEKVAGTHGDAYYDAAGTLHLLWVDEVPTTDAECGA